MLGVFIAISVILIIPVTTRANSDISLVYLANQFLHGHISIEPTLDMPIGDITLFNGRYYMYFGPFASIVLVPFAAIFGKTFPQAMIGIFSMIISFYAVYVISKFFKFSSLDSVWLAAFFTFSTVLFSLSIVNISAYQVQALGCAMIILSLREYFQRKKRPLLIGLFLGLALMTRMTLGLSVLFFVFEFLQKRITRADLVKILIPFAVCCIVLAGYNFVRFKNPFDSGYLHSTALSTYPISENMTFGYMGIAHVPTNLYALFLKGPGLVTESEHGFVLKFPYFRADPWGMAIWFTSPLFLAIIYKFRKNNYTKSVLLTTVALMFPVIGYFSVGFAQFGYRYALDFLPFLFLALIPCLLPKLTKTDISLIIVGVVFNCLYLTSLWGIYPHFGIY